MRQKLRGKSVRERFLEREKGRERERELRFYEKNVALVTVVISFIMIKSCTFSWT